MIDKDLVIKAQEAEILRLQQGFDELKSWCLETLDQETHDDYGRGFDSCCNMIINSINKITGASND